MRNLLRFGVVASLLVFGSFSALAQPPVPNATAATAVTSTGFTANWDASAGATGYFLDVSTDPGFGSFVTGYDNLPVASTSQAVTGLNPNTTYYYQVRATDGVTSASSNTISQLTRTDAPVADAASGITLTSFTANWNAVAGATGYRLDVSTVNTFVSFVSGFNDLAVAGTSQSVTGLGGGTTYYYRVRAENAAGASDNSGTITALTLPPAPAIGGATGITTTGLTANWSAATSATSYRLDVSTSAGFGSFVAGFQDLNVGNVTSSAVTGLSPGTTYFYRTRAVNGSGTSASSSTTSQITLPAAPVATAATVVTTTSFTANWGSVTGSTGYRLDVSTVSNFASFVSGFNNLAVGGTSQSVTGLAAGTTYFYRVRAENAAGAGSNSNSISPITIPAAPTATAATSVTTTSFTANWGSVTGATGYRLDVSSASDFSSFVSGFNNLSVAGTSQSVTGLSVGTTYYYRVRAEDAAGTSANSNTISQASVPGAPVATAATSVTTTSFTANWGSVTGATGYRLDVSLAADFSSFVGSFNNFSVAGTSQSVTGLTAGTSYFYRVRAENASGASTSSNTINVTDVPSPPVIGAETAVSSNGFTINWTPSTGATSYALDVSTSIGFGTFVAGYQDLNVGNVATFAVTGLLANTNYFYRLRAVNSGGVSVNSSIASQQTAPAIPGALAASLVTATSFNANWSVAPGATGYFLDVATDAGFTLFVSGYTDVSVGAVTTFPVTPLSPNTTYFYRVRAGNAGGTSASSSTISQVTAPAAPTANAATGVTSSTFTANWTASTGATGYRLDVSTDSLFSSFVSGYNNLTVAGTTQSVTGLSGNTRYHFRVRAVNGSLVSPNSNTSSLTTLPNAPGTPTATVASSVTTTSFVANWTVVGTATGYRLDVASDAGFTGFISGYNDLAVATNSQSVTGLTSGSTYFYRVRAENPGGPSGNSNTISVTTIPPAPVASAATGILTTSFTANWGSAAGATGYRLDAATDAGFASLVSGYNDLVVAGTSQSVTGLTPATQYFYRVRAVTGGGASVNSNTVTATTLASVAITTASPLPNGTAGVAYSQTLAATGGTTPYTWSVSAGSLPAGYSLSAAGLISGTVNGAGVFNFTAKVRSANSDSTTKAFTLTIVAASASKLNFLQQPTNAAASATIAPAITVEIEDTFGNPVTTDTRNVTLAIGTNPGGGILAGTTTVAAVAGVATFSTLSINLGGTGYTLTATSAPALTGATSSAFNITAGTATRLNFGVQPSADTAGVVITPLVTVRIEDNAGNLVTTDNRQVTLAIGTNPGGGVLSGTNPVAAVGGIATFSDISINKVGNGYTLTAAASPLTGATSVAFNLVAGKASRLTMLTQPSPLDTAGKVFAVQPRIQVEDVNGNIVLTDTATVIATRGNGTGALVGTTAVKAVNGIVTFTNLSYRLAESITINFNRTGLTGAISSGLTVVASSAAQVVFAVQPAVAAQAGVTLSPPVTVQLKDAFGNNVTTPSTMSMSIAPAGGLVGGGAQAVDGSGLATFPGLSVTVTGSKTLIATSSLGVTPDTSIAFNVVAAAASKLAIQTQPSANATAGIVFPQQPVVIIQDQFGNRTGDASTVTVAKGRGAGTLLGTQSVLANAGLATFTNLSYTGADTTSLDFSSIGLTGVTSTLIAVSPGAFTTFIVEAAGGGPVPSQQAGNPFNIQITAKDGSGNTVTSFTGTVGITSTGTLALGGGTTPAFTNGVLSTYQVSFNNTGTFTITATRTSGGAQTGTSSPIVITPGPLTSFLIETSGGLPIPTQTAGVPFTIRVTARDGNSNAVTSFTGPVFLSSATGRLLGDPLVSGAFVNGVLASQNVRLDGAGPARTITATTGSVTSSSSSFTVNQNVPKTIRVETAADGSGTLLGKQNVSSGTSITVYTIRRDSLTNFIDNVAATSWTLQVISGGVVAGDLVPSADKKSAVFTGAAIGKAIIQVSLAGLTSVNSDTLTVVVAGTPSKILVETNPNGTGTVVPAQSLTSGNTLVVYAIARDAASNFIGNVLANWTLTNRTGGVVTSDIDPPAGSQLTIFTARKIGSASIQADVAGLSPTPSGKITVLPGAPSSATAVAGTSGQSATVNTVFPVNLAINVKDVQGNNVPGVLTTFTAPGTGASGDFTAATTALSDTGGIARAGPFRANTRAGTYSDSARVSGVTDPVTFSMTNVGGAPNSITADSAARIQSTRVDTRFPLSLNVTVKDSFGNPSPSVPVTYTTVRGANGAAGVFSPGGSTAQFSTNSSGIAIPGDYVANDTAGSFTVRATVNLLTPTIFTLTNTAGSVSGINIVSGSNQSKLVGAVFDSVLTVRVLDGSNNPVPNVLVRFIAPSSGPSGRFGGVRITDSVFTNILGVARSTPLTANTLAGSFSVNVFASGIGTPEFFFLTNIPGSVANFLIETAAASGGPIPTQSAQVPFDIKITARDQFNNTATSFHDTVDITSTGTLSNGRGLTDGFVLGVMSDRTMEFLNSGTWTITVTRKGGLENGTSNLITVNNPVPTFVNIIPSFARRGQTVDALMNGSGFIAGVTILSFGANTSIQQTSVFSFYTLSVQFRIDTNAAEGPRTFLITNVGPGGGVLSVQNQFTIGAPVPILFSLQPPFGVRGQASTVVVNGSNFATAPGATTINFGPNITVDSAKVQTVNKMTAWIRVSAGAATVPHPVTVTTPGGTSDTLFFAVNVPPPPAPLLASPVNGAANQYTRQLLRWHPALAAKLFHVQVSASPAFTSLVIDDSTVTDTSRMVSPLLNNFLYYWRVNATDSGSTSAYSTTNSFQTGAAYPIGLRVIDSIDYPVRTNASDFVPSDYRIFGLPGAGGIGLENYLSGNFNKDWIAYTDNGAAVNYLTLYSTGPTFRTAPGRGFWVLRRGMMVVNDTVPSAPLDTIMGGVKIDLHTGWNIISDPYKIPVLWSNIQAYNGNALGPLPDSLYGFEGAFSFTTVLRPYGGYYFFNSRNLDSLSIPYFGYPPVPPGLPKPGLTEGWRVSVALKSDAAVERSMSFGVSSTATAAMDEADVRKPRAPAGVPSVYFNRPEWDPNYSAFATDVRAGVGELERWTFEVRSTSRRPLELGFEGLAAIPDGLDVFLIDGGRARSVDLRVQGAYAFTPATDITPFTIVVGTAAAVKTELASVLPKEFALGVNYPNPFNPSTTIPVAVPFNAEVTLKIYNILGEEIRTVYAGVLAGGRYWFTWDGRNDAGIPVSSGVYLSRLNTVGGRHFTGKMLMMK